MSSSSSSLSPPPYSSSPSSSALSRTALSNRELAEQLIKDLREHGFITSSAESHEEDVQEFVDLFEKKTQLRGTGHVKNHWDNLQRTCGWTVEEASDLLNRCGFTVFPWIVPRDVESKHCFLYQEGSPVWAIFNVHSGDVELLGRRKVESADDARRKRTQRAIGEFFKQQLSSDQAADALMQKLIGQEPLTMLEAHAYVQSLLDFKAIQEELAALSEEEKTPDSVASAARFRAGAFKAAKAMEAIGKVKMATARRFAVPKTETETAPEKPQDTLISATTTTSE